MITFRTATLLAMAALPGMAQSPFEVNVSALVGTGDTSKLTRSSGFAGISLNVGFRMEINPGLDHRLYLGAIGLQSKPATGLGSLTPKHLQVGWEVVQKVNNWEFFGGLMAVKWRQSGVTDPNFGDLPRTTPPITSNSNNSAKGTKLGARIGAQYNLNKQVGLTLNFTQTEFNKIYTPSWFAFGATYRF